MTVHEELLKAEDKTNIDRLKMSIDDVKSAARHVERGRREDGAEGE